MSETQKPNERAFYVQSQHDLSNKIHKMVLNYNWKYKKKNHESISNKSIMDREVNRGKEINSQ